MISKLKTDLNLKDGTSYPKGTSVSISVPENQPTAALLKIGSREIKIRSLSLSKYFRGFEKFDHSEVMESSIPSLTGEMVEPDGWDCKGFPSMLLAAGMI